MNKVFLTNKDVVVKSGYLSAVNKDNSMQPVSNPAFIAAQKHAEYVITFAKLAKGKDFKGKVADSLDSLKNEVTKLLSAKDTQYVTPVVVKEGKLTSQLKEEALAFINGNNNSAKAEKINKFLQQFNVISEFETIGLFFEPEIVKIDKIYTIEEIVEAVENVIDLI